MEPDCESEFRLALSKFGAPFPRITILPYTLENGKKHKKKNKNRPRYQAEPVFRFSARMDLLDRHYDTGDAVILNRSDARRRLLNNALPVLHAMYESTNRGFEQDMRLSERLIHRSVSHQFIFRSSAGSAD